MMKIGKLMCVCCKFDDHTFSIMFNFRNELINDVVVMIVWWQGAVEVKADANGVYLIF